MTTKTQGCCSDTNFIDFSKMELLDLNVRWADHNFWLAVLCIVTPPLFWNVVARWEYRSNMMSQVIGSARVACVFLALIILGMGAYRDWRFKVVLESQPRCYALQQNWILWSGYICVIAGSILVFASFWVLGFYGTFLGDYFGILMDKKVTDFPFSLTENPMYLGSTLNFIGTAIIQASVSGILLSILVAACYHVAILFEGPFTKKIYMQQQKNGKDS